MWNSQVTKFNPDTLQFKLEKAGRLMTIEEVITAWEQEHNFRQFYSQLLADAPFNAFFWELPPVTHAVTNRPFEFVLANSNALARVSPEVGVFSAYFQNQEQIVVFDNLGGDATLVVPTPQGEKSCYSHLAQFVRSGLEDQISEFWEVVGRTYRSKISDRPLWLSTSGLGVYWLHVRLDAYPKYYTYAPYRQSVF